MLKNIMVRIFLDIKEYTNIKEAADTRRIKADSESELFRKILNDYVDKIASVVISQVVIEQKVSEFKTALSQKDSVIEQLRTEVTNARNELDDLKENLRKNVK